MRKDIGALGGVCLGRQSLSSPAVRCDGTTLGGLKRLHSKDLLRCSEGHSLLLGLSESSQGFINEVFALLLDASHIYVFYFILTLPLVWRDGLGICG